MNASWAIFQFNHGEKNYISMRGWLCCFVLDQHTELHFHSAISSLKQQSMGRHVTLLSHIIPIPSLNASCLAEKQQISNLIVQTCIWLDLTVARTHLIYYTWGNFIPLHHRCDWLILDMSVCHIGCYTNQTNKYHLIIWLIMDISD